MFSLPSMNSTSSVISASANLLDPFSSVVDPIPPSIATPVMSHMSGVDGLQTTDSHVSMMDKAMPLSNSMSDNSAQLSMQMPLLPEPEQKDPVQEQLETHLPRISEAFDTPLIANDPIKAIEADLSSDPSNRMEEAILPKSDDSRSQEAITANYETSKQSMSSDSVQADLVNNGLTDTMSQNDNALQQAPEADKLIDPMAAYSNTSTSLPMDNVIGQDSQSMPFDQSSNHSQYSLPAGNGQTMLGDNNQMQNAGYIQPHPGMLQHAYPPPMSHPTERQMIQAQMNELYCILQTPDVLEKIKRLDDRLKLLQQHETNEQCMGGPQCVLLNPMMTAPMIESPQVSSTTGRGRSRGSSSKPRKPRQKKSDKQQSPGDANVDAADVNSTIKSTDQLPVSEDCVTQGAGLAADDIINEMTDVHEEGSQDGTNELDTSTTADGKKPKKSKSRSRKDSKEPKEPKEPKERKKKEAGETKKKSRSKRNDKSTDQDDLNASKDAGESEANQTLDDAGDDSMKKENSLNDESPDFDDIPVSKIPVKSLLEEAAKKEDAESEQTDIETATPKSKRRSSGNRSGNSRSRKRSSVSRSGKKPVRSRARIICESDGEGEDMATPPPSPPPDADFDSSKRRSARNTQRKKYIDDVMLSISDDESDIVSPTKSKDKKSTSVEKIADAMEASDAADAADTAENIETSGKLSRLLLMSSPILFVQYILEWFIYFSFSICLVDPQEGPSTAPAVEKIEPVVEANKPNYVYVNTAEEDSMVVQFVLAWRRGKRELIPDPPPKPVEIKTEETEKSDDAPKSSEGEENSPKVEEKSAGEETEVKSETDASASVVGENAVEEKKDEDTPAEKSESTAEEENVESEKIAEAAEPMETDGAKVETEEKIETAEQSTEQSEDVAKELAEENVAEEVVKESDATDAEKSSESDVAKEAEKTEEQPMETDAFESKDEVKTEKKAEEQSASEAKAETEVKTEDKTEKPEPVFVEVDEYYVKYRNFSYLHCEWRTEEELLKGDRRVSAKIRRFQTKSTQMNIFDNLEDEPFNPDFVETDRVLDMSVHEDPTTGKKTRNFLVKWKSLPYEDCTWELEEDVEEKKIDEYMRFNKVPPKDKWKPKRRPSPDMWRKLEESPVYKSNNTLRPYQLEGLNWLKFSWYNSHNCILADEMGLGKTVSLNVS